MASERNRGGGAPRAPRVVKVPGLRDAGRSEADEVIAGLNASSPSVSPKYLYGPLGSRLFEAITELPEYYPTRTEHALFERHRVQIAAVAGNGVTLIDLGAGNCEKARGLFGALRPVQYVAVDVSGDFLRGVLEGLQQGFPDLDIVGVDHDFSAGIVLPDIVVPARRLFFYPGSSIGNFTPDAAEAFLRSIHARCGETGALLIGVDLVKDTAVLQAAYDDALGVTAAFNLNVLNNLNALLDSDFSVRDWRHLALFNVGASRIEMHLEAKRDLQVTWRGGGRTFTAGQRIHTENSYKYRLDAFRALLERAGFRDVTVWTDQREWFALFHAVA